MSDIKFKESFLFHFSMHLLTYCLWSCTIREYIFLFNLAHCLWLNFVGRAFNTQHVVLQTMVWRKPPEWPFFPPLWKLIIHSALGHCIYYISFSASLFFLIIIGKWFLATKVISFLIFSPVDWFIIGSVHVFVMISFWFWEFDFET